MTDSILVERTDALATIVLNRPERMNALDKTMWLGVGEAIGALSADDSLRCVVMRGAGGKAFAAGADIAEFENERSDPERAKAYSAAVDGAMRAVAECSHPVVALIEGACIGGGLEMAMVCDIRICGESSRFGVPINRLGLTMGWGELSAVVGVLGPAAALQILLEGRVFGAGEAKELGLVHRVVPDDEVEEEAYATAERIAQGAPLVNRWHKRFIRRLADPAPLSEAERNEPFACYDTEDYRLGVEAFLAKTRPDFKGR